MFTLDTEWQPEEFYPATETFFPQRWPFLPYSLFSLLFFPNLSRKPG